MGVYVKGMKMPKDGCRDCILVNRKWHGDVCPILKREVTGNVERGGFQTDCPLIKVPEPHGRLIDADAVFDNLERTGWYDNADRDIAEDLVLDAPTFIPASGEET